MESDLKFDFNSPGHEEQDTKTVEEDMKDQEQVRRWT